MAHYKAQEWQEYICGNVDTGAAMVMEQHLIQCGACLDLYLRTAENALCGEVSSQFTEAVMAKLPTSVAAAENQNSAARLWSSPGLEQSSRLELKQKPVEVSSRPGFSKQSLGNYAIAACLTLLLTAGGVFGGVASALPQLKGLEISAADKAAQKISSGWSEEVAKKTLSIIDIIKPD